MSKVLYDKYYVEESYFGDPCPELVNFFKNYDQKGYVLDLGCGQGRDSIALGKLGYKVKGLDISSTGIKQLNAAAKELKIDVIGEVADIYTYKITSDYDIVLLDSMFHFYKNDYKKEREFLERIIFELKPGALLCILTLKNSKTQDKLNNIISGANFSFEIVEDKFIKYPDFNSYYHMKILKVGINNKKGQ